MDASGVGLGDALLQTRSGTSCPRDKASDNSILSPITFVSTVKLGTLYGLEKLHHYCFLREEGMITDNKQLVAVFKKCSNTFTETTMNFTQNTPIHIQNHIQAWTRSIHSRLALQIKPQGKQRCSNT